METEITFADKTRQANLQAENDRLRQIYVGFIDYQGMMVKLITQAIEELCDIECPHCQGRINLPNQERIEDWLRGMK